MGVRQVNANSLKLLNKNESGNFKNTVSENETREKTLRVRGDAPLAKLKASGEK